MLSNKFFLLAFFAFAFHFGTAQEKTVTLKHITSQEGLSDNQVTCVLRDKRGFMWIGTKDGLNRYDGREFYVFKHNPEDVNAVCGNNIKCIEQDGDSLIWIGTSGNGFCSYDFRTGKFTSYNKNNLDLITNRINDIAYDKYKNQLWIGQNNHGLQIFDLKTKSIDRNKKLISKNTYYDVEIKDSVAYFAGIVESLKRIENIGKFRTSVEKEGRTLNKILVAGNGTIWCGAWDNGLHEFNSGTTRLNTYFFDGSNKLKQSGDEILSLVEDENNILWCGTKSSGIHFFDIEKRIFTGRFKFSIPVNSRVNNLYRDDFNRIWIATETGLYLYDPLQNQFEIIKLPVPPGTNSCKVNGRIVLPGGKELIATNCGLFYKNQQDSEYRFKEIYYRNEKQELTSIFSDTGNRIYIGTNRTIFLLDTISPELVPVPANKKTLAEAFYFIPASRVNSIAQINHNGLPLIAASFYGHSIALLDPTRKNIFYMLQDTLKKEGFLDNLSRKIFADSKNNFWICGASDGITKVIIPPAISFSNYPVSDSLIREIYVDIKNWSKKSSGKIKELTDAYDILENKDGSYWLTTQGKGLVKFFPGNDTLPFISYAGNLNSLQGLTRDDTGNLWTISSAGLLKYNTASQRYTLYSTKAGIPESLGGYFFQSNSTSVTAGFDGGFITFNPGKILTDTEKPRVFISQIWVMDTKADSLLYSPVKLNYNNNFLKFYISANCFSTNDQVNYIYQLTGIDNDWRNNENNPIITYTNLPAGNFEFKYKAINSDGVESEVFSLPVTITPPFYKTIYFYLLILAIIVLSVYVLYKYRIRQILKLQEVRNKIARDLHDDIGSTLGSIHLYSQIANKKLNGEKPEEIKTILEKIESSSSEIIDKTGDAVWAVKASNDTLKNLILRIESYAASLLGAAGIQFNIEYDERIAGMKLEMTERKNIFLVFKEATHNIVKYAGCTEVNIVIKKSADKLVISISDNGNGFIANGMNPYNGNGIKNMKSRAEEMKGNFQITSQEGKGTTINITI